MPPLFSQSAELALDLLEKNGVLLPFCRLSDQGDHISVISPDGDGDRAEESVRAELRRRIQKKEVKQFALCADVQTKFAHSPDSQRCLRIEFQDGTDATGVYYFPLTVQDGRASLGKYLVADVPNREL